MGSIGIAGAIRRPEASQHVVPVEREVSILRADVEQSWGILLEYSVIQVVRPPLIFCLESQFVEQERKVVHITGTQNDGVDVFRRSILEMDCLAFNFSEQWCFLAVVRPFEDHRIGSVADDDGHRAMFVTLRADVFRYSFWFSEAIVHRACFACPLTRFLITRAASRIAGAMRRLEEIASSTIRGIVGEMISTPAQRPSTISRWMAQ
jgi:hypothetical protein